jgi:outer membrane usher protein
MTVRGPNNKSVFLTLTRALDDRTTLNIGGNRQSTINQGTAQLERSLPLGTGWGYNLYGAQSNTSDYQATAMGQNDIGTYSAGLAQQQGIRGYQLEARGSMALMNHHVYLARVLGNSLGVIKIPGHPHVRVYEHNQEIGRTNNQGEAFIPDLLPYQNNSIKIEQSDLSLDTRIKTTEIQAVPYNNSGLVIEFPVDNLQSGIVHLIDTAGLPIPAGASVENIDLSSSQTIVANEGEAYLTHLHTGKNAFKVSWDNQVCFFTLTYSKTPDPLPDLGDIKCSATVIR